MTEQATMTDPDAAAGGGLWRWLRLFGLATAIIFLIGVGAGFTAGHLERGGGMTMRPLLILGAVGLAIILCGWLALRELRRARVEEPLTPKERLNRNILYACAAIGGAMGVAMAIVGGEGVTNGRTIFSDAPIPTWLAIAFVFVLGVVLPIISVFWHRTVDEQEADAYKTGALYGFYVFAIGGPVWWFAWRGGFAPEPSGILIYFATMLTVGVIWTWKKYG
jgi:hypothetical protein